MTDDFGTPTRTIAVLSDDFLFRIHQRQREVLGKLCKAYNIEKKELEHDSVELPLVNDAVKMLGAFMNVYGETLSSRITLSAQESGMELNQQQKENLVGVCEGFARDCLSIFKLHEVLQERKKYLPGVPDIAGSDSHAGRIPPSGANARMIENVYNNLVFREALTRIKTFGFKDKDAIHLASFVIGAMVREGPYASSMEPFKPLGCSEKEKEKWHQRILGFAEEMRKALNDEHKLYAGR